MDRIEPQLAPPQSAGFCAERLGRISYVDVGPMEHTGPRGYLSSSARLPDGRSYLDVTVDAIAAVAEGGVNPGTSPTPRAARR